MTDDLTLLDDALRRQRRQVLGKFRAFVEDNADPERRGRLKLVVPSVLGSEATSWALPCLPYGGAAGLGFLFVPPVGAQVLAEFLEGDVNSPIWTGTFWRSSGEVPDEVEAQDEPTTKLIKTDSGHFLRFEDTTDAAHVTLQSSSGAVIEMDKDGSLALTGQDGGTVILNAAEGTLTVEDANGNSMVLSSSGIECTDASGNKITTSSGGVEIAASASVTIKGSSVTLGGVGAEPLVKGQTFLSIFNAHTHPCTAPGSPSGPPVPPMTPAALTTVTSAS
jgi:hypothetical protein